MRISFTGAQGVGKSTLIEAVAPHFPDYHIQRESVRYMVKKYGFDIQSADPTLQLAVLNLQTKSILGYEDILLDRSVIDSTAYMLYYHRRKNPEVPQAIMDLVMDTSKELAQKLDYIVFMQPEFDLVDDGFRVLDVDQQKEINDIMKGLIETFDVSHKVIWVRGSVEERVEEVLFTTKYSPLKEDRS